MKKAKRGEEEQSGQKGASTHHSSLITHHFFYSDGVNMEKQRFVRPYMWAFIALGAFVVVYSALNLPLSRLDVRLVPLVAVTLLISSRFCVPIPRTTGQVSFSDTLLFLTLLLYGGEVAVLFAAAELFAASRLGKKPFSIFTSLFNAAMMACSTLVPVL